MSTEETPKWKQVSKANAPMTIGHIAHGTWQVYGGERLLAVLNALEARARWAEDVALPALEHIAGPSSIRATKVTEAFAALAAYPQPEKENKQ